MNNKIGYVHNSKANANKKFEKQKKLAKKIHQQLQELPLEKENDHLEKINEMLQEILEE